MWRKKREMPSPRKSRRKTRRARLRNVPEPSIYNIAPREMFEILQEDTQSQFLPPKNAASDILNDIAPGERWEVAVGYLHFKNVAYTRAKVLKRDVISRARFVAEEVFKAGRVKKVELFQESQNNQITKLQN
jgi:hypothetical protein